jgi:hypothetical protein
MRLITTQIATLVGLLMWAIAAHADVFTVALSETHISFVCDGAALVDAPCRIEIRRDRDVDTIPALFASKPTRYAHLLKDAIEKAIANYQPPYQFSPAEISLLRNLPIEKCHPGVGESLDTLELCIGSPSTVVIFRRDVCDRCEFQPIILIKK